MTKGIPFALAAILMGAVILIGERAKGRVRRLRDQGSGFRPHTRPFLYCERNRTKAAIR
jgi:hypothetical protein